MDIYTVNASDLLEYIGEDKQQQLSDSFNPAKKSTPHNCLTIDDDYVPKICFAETLNFMDENGKKLGKFVGKIRATGSNDTDLKSITVNMHSTSVFDDGDKTGMTVATNTTSNFDSYEEKWSQWYENKSETMHKTVLISKKNGCESIDVCTELNDDGLVDKSKNIVSKRPINLLTEGMNYAYLRYLAIMGFEGSIKSKTAVTINGRMYKAIYICSLRKKYEINDVCVPVVIVQRILIDERSTTQSPQHMTTVLTRSGYMLKHSWNKTTTGNKQLTIGKSMHITNDGYVYNDTMSYLRKNWDQDIRFKSMYLNKVSEMRAKYKNYLKNNGVVKDIIIDYVKEILLVKPDDVLQFSIDYFDGN